MSRRDRNARTEDYSDYSADCWSGNSCRQFRMSHPFMCADADDKQVADWPWPAPGHCKTAEGEQIDFGLNGSSSREIEKIQSKQPSCNPIREYWVGGGTHRSTVILLLAGWTLDGWTANGLVPIVSPIRFGRSPLKYGRVKPAADNADRDRCFHSVGWTSLPLSNPHRHRVRITNKRLYRDGLGQLYPLFYSVSSSTHLYSTGAKMSSVVVEYCWTKEGSNCIHRVVWRYQAWLVDLIYLYQLKHWH